MKYFVLIAVCALASVLSAQVTYYTGTAGGYSVSEHDISPTAPPQFAVAGGVAWDPSGSDVYYYDMDTTTIRRFDTTTNTPAATPLYLVPNPGFLPYVDDIEFDENVTTDMYFVESGGPYIYKLRRATVDTLDASFSLGGVQTSTLLSVYPYDLEFDPYSRLFVSGSNFGTSCGVWIVDQSTLAVTQVVDLLSPAGSNSSGPVVFDQAGNMYCLLPPTFGSSTPMRIVRFDKTKVDTAVASAGASLLTVADGTMIVDGTANFPNGGRALLHREFGKDILYFTANDGSVLRSDLSTGAFTVFAQAAAPTGTDTNAPSALALQASGDFRPYSGDTNRLCALMYTTDTNFTVTASSVCFFDTAAAPASVSSLEITDAPTSVSNGGTFRFEIELRDATNMLVTGDDGAVSVQILSGAGTLGGTTFHASTYGAAVFDDLTLTGASGSVILRFSLVGSGIVVDSQVIGVSGGGSGGSNSSKGDSNSGCSAGDGDGWLALLGLLGMALVAARLRRAAKA